jgi:ketosteroid isomerase-like protein
VSDEEQGDERPGLMGRIKGAFSSDDDEGNEREGEDTQDEESGESQPDLGPTDEQRANPPSAGSRTETVRNALRAFADGDADSFLGALGDEVEWVGPLGRHAPGAGTHRGRDAIQNEFLGAVGERFEGLSFRPATYLEGLEEDLVVVIGAFEGSGAQGEVDAPAVLNWTFVEDRVVRVEVFTDSEHFRRATEGEEEPEEEESETEGADHEGQGDEGGHDGGAQDDGASDTGQEGQDDEGDTAPQGEAQGSREAGSPDEGENRQHDEGQGESGGGQDEAHGSETGGEDSTTQRG